jgi:hypothetical protein
VSGSVSPAHGHDEMRTAVATVKMIAVRLRTTWQRWRNRLVWELEELGQSGMEPSHRPGHPVFRESPDSNVRDDTTRRLSGEQLSTGSDEGRPETPEQEPHR